MNRWAFFIGAVFGFGFGGARFGDYNVVHNTLLLRDFQPYLVMLSTVATAAPLLWVLTRLGWVTPFGGKLVLNRYPVTRKDFFGSAVLGTGWALAGTCPGAVLMMIGGGSILGLVPMIGIFVGLALRGWVVGASTGRPNQVDAPGGAVLPLAE